MINVKKKAKEALANDESIARNRVIFRACIPLIKHQLSEVFGVPFEDITTDKIDCPSVLSGPTFLTRFKSEDGLEFEVFTKPNISDGLMVNSAVIRIRLRDGEYFQDMLELAKQLKLRGDI